MCTRLVKAALRRARLLGYSYVVALESPRYHQRFGFTPASRFGLSCQAPIVEAGVMALELIAGALTTGIGPIAGHGPSRVCEG